MKQVLFGNTGKYVPSVIVGCMRFSEMSPETLNHMIHHALDLGANFFDHADIYGGGKCESLFGEAWACDSSIKREDMIIQSKCGIDVWSGQPNYNQTKDYILNAVDGILTRLKTDYLDVLLLHRPDALVDPEEVAEAFSLLEASGKVRAFGVSNHKPMQIELLSRALKQPIAANQLQFSLPVSNMIANGMEVNMTTDGAIDRDGSVLDYSRIKHITVQAWSPFQMKEWRGCFIGSDAYPELNKVIGELGEKYGVGPNAIATAWITRHPAGMQLVAGTTNEERLSEIVAGSDVTLTHNEWYRLYLAAGHILP